MDEEKYIDLLESLKKNDAIKGYVVNTLVEKVGETRTVKKILDVLSEKYAKNLGEKTQDTMRMISGSNFKTEDKIEMKIDKFEEMVTEVDRIGLVDNFKYAMSLQFLEWLEKCGDINTVQRMTLKDVIEYMEGNPKAGDTLELMKKDLKKI